MKLGIKIGLLGATLVALPPALLAACNASEGTGNVVATGGAGATGGTSGADGSAASGGVGATFEGGLDVIKPPDDAPLTSDSACSATGDVAKPVPVNVYLMVDISGSMSSLLSTVKQGLSQFFQDPQSAGLRVCLNYFPKDSGSTCDPSLFYNPEVPLGELTPDPAPLDAQESLLVNSINSKSVTGLTPMYGALKGALDFSKDHVATNAGEKMIVILTTDGSPNSCATSPDNQNDINYIAGLSAHYWNAYAVATYAIGLVGSKETEIKLIAENAGGSAFFLGGSSNVAQDLIAALKAISKNLIACEYAIPTETEAGVVDTNKVNVEFTDGNDVKHALYKVDAAAKCVPDGWYYETDTAGVPVSIKLCPGACATVQSDSKSKIDILLGCASEKPPE